MNQSVAIVTGASQGIGRATAIRLAQDFAVVVLAARNSDNLNATAAEVEKAGAKAHVVVTDLSLPDAAKLLVEETLATFGQIDAVLNIAGAVPGIDLMEMTDQQWIQGAELKLHGARRLTIHAWDALKKSRGSVVFISGTAALEPKAATAAVAVINAAIDALAKAFAEKGVREGVQVNSMLPGAILTQRRRAMLEKAAAQQQITVDAAIERFPEKVGIARLGTPEEIANLLAYLVSPGARWLTGTAVRMDGGEVRGI
ncbi:SDR family oxidoreductase [Granulicella sp. S190]|uniref:SDR family oxidoreductase n=1 Tax=Granulicella sp. S190 TaxID=1747226 RepID=UPI00131DB13E|nr:SDR family oxidoreductase [Granulicella sp. S190]